MTHRVAMNLLWCVPGVGGSEEYLVRQLLGLSELQQREWEVDVFAPRGFAERRPDVSQRYRISEAPSQCHRRPQRVALEHTWLARATHGYDLVHHGGGSVPRDVVPLWRHRATLLTVHDVQWTEYPEYVRPIKLKYLRHMVPSSLKRATQIAVPSEFVAGTLHREFNVERERIGVVRHGLEHDLSDNVSSESDVRRRFALGDGPVLVYPAITHPHKNHAFLLSLLAHGEGLWGDPRLRLVCAGSTGLADHAVRGAITAMGLADRVIMPGRVNDADRNGLLALATAMVFPSQYEGFGAPLIEAMAVGTPILCSDRGSIPEVVGDAGVVAPLEQSAWVQGLAEVVSRRESFVARGRARARLFTAAESARDLSAQYEIVMQRSRSAS